MKRLSRSICIIVCLCTAVASAEWSQWRGENRDGILTQFSAPMVWPKQLKSFGMWSWGAGTLRLSLKEGGFTRTHGRSKTKLLLHLTSKRVRCFGRIPMDRCRTCGPGMVQNHVVQGHFPRQWFTTVLSIPWGSRKLSPHSMPKQVNCFGAKITKNTSTLGVRHRQLWSQVTASSM